MSDFRMFGLKSTGNDVLVNVDHIRSVGAACYLAERSHQAVLYMVDGTRIDLCDYFEVVVTRLTCGDDSPLVAAASQRLGSWRGGPQ